MNIHSKTNCLFLSFLLVLYSYSGIAQNKNETETNDSLMQKISIAQNETVRIQAIVNYLDFRLKFDNISQFSLHANPLIGTLLTEFKKSKIVKNLEDKKNYFEGKLKYCQANVPYENSTHCYFAMVGFSNYSARYNHAITNYLKAAEIYKQLEPVIYRNEIGVLTSCYLDWGDLEKAKEFANNVIEIKVSDNGNGNPQKVLDKIF